MSSQEKTPQGPQRVGQTRAPRTRSWRELAQATAEEQDPSKVVRRARELIRALDSESDRRMEQSRRGRHRDKPAS